LSRTARSCFLAALALDQRDVQTLVIPYAGTTLPGYYYPATRTSGPAATLVAHTGFDGTQEELRAIALAANARGMHCANCLAPEIYRPVVQTMEVEQLLAAGQPITDDQLTTKQRYSIEEGLPRFGFEPKAENLTGWAEMLKQMTLWGLEDKIIIPLLNMSAAGEGKLMYDNAKAFFDALPNPRNRFVLTNEDQGAELDTQRGNSSLLHQIQFDWLDEVFSD
jgi:hypothetical protein